MLARSSFSSPNLASCKVQIRQPTETRFVRTRNTVERVLPEVESPKLHDSVGFARHVGFGTAFLAGVTWTFPARTTRHDVRISCRACFLFVKAAMINPMFRIAAERILAK